MPEPFLNETWEEDEHHLDEESEEEENDVKPKKKRCTKCKNCCKGWFMKNNILSPFFALHPNLNRIERALITGSSFMVVLTISAIVYDIAPL